MKLNDLKILSSKYIIPQINVDFIRNSYISISSKQLDNVRYIIINCTENGIFKKISPTWRANIRLKKPDKNIVYNQCEIIEETGQVLVSLTEQILAASGKAKADIQFITDENTIYSTKNFYLDISEMPYNNDEIISTYEFDVLNKTIIKADELVKVCDEMKTTVSEFEIAEDTRVKNESDRIQNEITRSETFQELKDDIESKIEIVQNLTDDIVNAVESTNQALSSISELSSTISSAEEIRENNENNRISNEIQRVQNEDTRIENENIRQSNEKNRQDNETIRQENEDIRNNTESERNKSEAVRVQAEIDRNNSETVREQSEETRNNNELARNNAEILRKSAEEERIINTSTAIENANKATDRANIAAEACENIVAGTGFISTTEKGSANGVVPLNENKKIDNVYIDLNSEIYTTASTPPTGQKDGEYWTRLL